MGSADNYFLNDAVYLIGGFSEVHQKPALRRRSEIRRSRGALLEWRSQLPNYLSRLHYNTMYLPNILDRIQKTAPPGADLTSWRY